MATAKLVKAGKDHPQFGIKKGEMHYFAEVMMGPRSSKTIRSLKPIPRSQLTASSFLSTAYDLSDQIDAATSVDELESIKDGFEELRDETQESLDNMPEGLQQGDTGQMLQERIDQCESLVSELESAIQAAQEDSDDDDDDDEDGDKVEDSEADKVRAAVEEHVSSQF